MSSHSARVEPRQSTETASVESVKTPLADPDLDVKDALLDDERLVKRCILGEVAAWEEIYHRCHEPLCRGIRIRLGHLGNDPHLVDEMAARVWYAVVDKDGKRLTKYDPRRGGGILTFLKLIARDEISRYIRSERRRLKRELISFTRINRADGGDRGESVMASLSEFLATLTPREQSFCGDYLLAASGENGEFFDSSHSPGKIWQLTRSVYKKFLNYIGKNP